HYQSNWSDWHSGYWTNWHSCPAAWYGAGVGRGAGLSWMYHGGPMYAYRNPFYTGSTYASDPGLDYSQQIQLPAPAPANVNYATYVQAPATATDSIPQYQYTQQAESTQQYVQPTESPPQYVQQAESALQYVQQALTPPPPAEAVANMVPPDATQDF